MLITGNLWNKKILSTDLCQFIQLVFSKMVFEHLGTGKKHKSKKQASFHIQINVILLIIFKLENTRIAVREEVTNYAKGRNLLWLTDLYLKSIFN